MAPTVYLETTIIGYLAMRESSVLRIAANQETTREWWNTHRQRFELFISRHVVEECAQGDPVAAKERLVLLEGLTNLEVNEDVENLADLLINGVPLPRKATIDAFHVSVAAVHGIEFLLTWNCKHIANPALRPRIERVCREAGFEPPAICTPLELLGLSHDD